MIQCKSYNYPSGDKSQFRVFLACVCCQAVWEKPKRFVIIASWTADQNLLRVWVFIITSTKGVVFIHLFVTRLAQKLLNGFPQSLEKGKNKIKMSCLKMVLDEYQ